MRNDSTKLADLVEKYHKMHAEGPGRRLLWSLMESGNLTDLRRRIGYHEQTLQLWYMTLVYGSLRRLEGGQEDIIAAIKSMRKENLRKVSASLYVGDDRPLKRELRERGMSVDYIEANMETAIDYITAPPIEKLRMESRVQSRSTAPTTHVFEDGRRYSSRDEFPDTFLGRSKFGRSISTSAGPRYRHHEDSEAQAQPEKSSQRRSPRNVTVDNEPTTHKRRASDSLGSRAHARPVIVVQDHSLPNQSQPPISHHRSKSQREIGRSSSDAGRDREEKPSYVVIVEPRGGRSKDKQEDMNRRDSSTHSYHRRRRRSSVESPGRGEDKDIPRQVHIMDRIDSIPVDPE